MKSLIHEKSAIVPHPRFDLFSLPPTQDTVERHIICEDKPISNIDMNSFLQFEVKTTFDEYLDLEKLFLLLKVRVKENPLLSAASLDTKWDDIEPKDYLLNTMIKQLDIFIGDTQVSSSTPTYAYKAFIEVYLGFSNSAKDSHLSSTFYHGSKGSQIDYDPMEIYGRLHSDLVFQNKVLLGGCKLTLRILFNDSKFVLQCTDANIKPEIQVVDATLRTVRYKVSQEIVEAHDAALQVTPSKYILAVSRVKPFHIIKGVTESNIENIQSGQLPRRLFIGFVDTEAYNGHYTKSPYTFNHFDLNSIALYVNGEQIPPRPYTPNFDTACYAKEYISLFEALNMIDAESTIDVNMSDYKKAKCIYGFNLSVDCSGGPGSVGYCNPVKYGSIALSVKFKEALSRAITCIIYMEFDKLLEIDINRNAKIDLF